MKTNIITKYLKNSALAAIALISTGLTAQDEEITIDVVEEKSKFNFSGSVAAYLRTNLNGLNKFIPDADGNFFSLLQAPGTSFANRPGFALGFVNLIAGYEGEKVGFVADLVFGPRGEEAVFGSPIGSSNIVNQLYVYWNVTEKTKLTFGNFNTFLGYEVISPTGNFNYSTSYMFSYGPFSHAGLKADFDLGNDLSAMVGVFNATDFTDINPFGALTVGAQLGYSGQYLNVLVGNQGSTDFFNGTEIVDGDTNTLFQIDYTGGFDLTDSFYLGLNATYQDTDGTGFYGAAVYPQLTTSDSFAIGLRGEYFAVVDGFDAGIGNDAGGDGNVFAVTLTGSGTIGGLTIKPELRLDTVGNDQEVFLDNDLNLNSSLASFLLAAVYSF